MPRHLKKVPPEMIFWSPTKLGHTVTAAFPEIQEDRIYPFRKTSDVYTLKIRNIKHSETKFPSLSDNCALSENHFFSRNPSKGSEPCDSQSSKLSKWQIVIEHINSNPNHSRYRLHLDMREYLSNLLGPESGFEKVCIIDDDAPNTRLQCRSAFHT